METRLESHWEYIDIQITEGPVRWSINPDNTAYYDQAADLPSFFVFSLMNLHNSSFAAEGVIYAEPLHKIVTKVADAE